MISTGAIIAIVTFGSIVLGFFYIFLIKGRTTKFEGMQKVTATNDRPRLRNMKGKFIISGKDALGEGRWKLKLLNESNESDAGTIEVDESEYVILDPLGNQEWISTEIGNSKLKDITDKFKKVSKQRDDARKELTRLKRRFDAEVKKQVDNAINVINSKYSDDDKKGSYRPKHTP